MLSLVVNDFGVKYTGTYHADHLVQALMTNYKIAIDWKGETLCGIALKWDYNKRTVDLSIPGYVKKALLKF